MKKAISAANQGPKSKIMSEKNQGQKSRVSVPLIYHLHFFKFCIKFGAITWEYAPTRCPTPYECPFLEFSWWV